MNYPFKEAVLRFVKGGAAQELAEAVTRICENYPGPALNVLMNFVSTHDTVRAITAIAGEPCEGRDRYWQSGQRLSREQYEQGRRKLVLAYALIFTLPGLPSVYYGDEIGIDVYKRQGLGLCGLPAHSKHLYFYCGLFASAWGAAIRAAP